VIFLWEDSLEAVMLGGLQVSASSETCRMESVMMTQQLSTWLVVLSLAVIGGCTAEPELARQWPMGPGPVMLIEFRE